jgi:hypothetical protein
MAKAFSRRRRSMLKGGFLGVAAVTLAGARFSAGAQEQPPPQKLDASDPLAQALKYTTDASAAPSSLRKPDSFCHNCQFYQGTGDAGEAPCQIFQGKLVVAQGWCNSWVMKT